MIVMIGIVAMTALVWVLAYSMACESAAEKRRRHLSVEQGISPTSADVRENMRHAA
jgi:hypothetical protein